MHRGGDGEHADEMRGAVMGNLWNKYNKHCPSDAVSIMRPGPFGNQFVIGKHGTRAEVCGKYAEWAYEEEQKDLRNQMRRELAGKDIVCCCVPAQCHGETVAAIANSPIEP